MQTGTCTRCGEKITDEDHAGVGGAKKAHRMSAAENGLQSHCASCRVEYNRERRKKDEAPDARERAADPAERAWVLSLQHERGKPHDPEHCPLCKEMSAGVVLAMAGGNSLARFGDASPPEGT